LEEKEPLSRKAKVEVLTGSLRREGEMVVAEEISFSFGQINLIV
jgi:hypothetical protein